MSSAVASSNQVGSPDPEPAPPDLLADLFDALSDPEVQGSASRMRELSWRFRGAMAQLEGADGVPDPTARLDEAHATVRAWTRSQQPESFVPEDPQCAEAIVESCMPLTWDVGRDLVILFGASMRAIARALSARGQKRILFVLTRREARAWDEATLGGKIIERHDDQVINLAPWVRDPPKRFIWFRDAGIEADRAERKVEQLKRLLPELKLWRNTIETHGTKIISQSLENLPAVMRHPCVDRLMGAFRGRPMVIVAPGPSAEANIEHVRSFVGKAVIVSLGHSFKALTKAGVLPDIVVSIDMLDQRYLFEGLPVNETTLLTAAGSHPGVVSLPARNHFVCSSGATFDAWPFHVFGERPFLGNGGTVAGTAMSLGVLMGCDPIIFVGLDLAFSEGRYYVSSVSGGDRRVRLSDDGQSLEVRAANRSGQLTPDVRMRENLVMLPGYHGGQVPSNPPFAVFHGWFERQAKLMAGRPRLINCTEGGAKIEGMRQMPLIDAAQEFCGDAFSVREILDARAEVPSPQRGPKILERAEAMKSQVGAFLRAVEKSRKLATNVAKGRLRDYERFLEAHSPLVCSLNTLPFVPILHQVDFVYQVDAVKAATTETDQARAALTLYRNAEQSAKWVHRRLQEAIEGARDRVRGAA